MHSGDFQKKAPRPAASFFVYNGIMPELDEEQRKIRRWRRAYAVVLVIGVIVLALLVVVLVLTRG
jgi:hypothetical protein